MRLRARYGGGFPLAAPTDMLALLQPDQSVDLSATDTNSDEIGHRWEKSTDGGTNWVTLTTTPANDLTATDPGPVTAGPLLLYRVRALRGVEVGPASDAVEAIVPPVTQSWVAFRATSRIFYAALDRDLNTFTLLDDIAGTSASSVLGVNIVDDHIVTFDSAREFQSFSWDGSQLVADTAVSTFAASVGTSYMAFGAHDPATPAFLSQVRTGGPGSWYSATFHSYDLSVNPPVLTQGTHFAGTSGTSRFSHPVMAFRETGRESGYGTDRWFMFADNSLARASLATVDFTGAGTVTVDDSHAADVGNYHDYVTIERDEHWAVSGGGSGNKKWTCDLVANTITYDGIVTGIGGNGPLAACKGYLLAASGTTISVYSLSGLTATLVDSEDIAATYGYMGASLRINQMAVDPFTEAILVHVTSLSIDQYMVIAQIDDQGNLTTFDVEWFADDWADKMDEGPWAACFSGSPLATT